MLFRTHIVFGVLLYLLLFKYVEVWWLFLIGVIVGVLIVDLDSSKSKHGRFFIFRPFQWFIKHRGLVHSLLFGFLVMIIVAIFNVDLAFGFIIGFLSHIFLDMLNPKGVMLFWPLFKKRFGFMIKSGSIFEEVIFVILLIIDLILPFYLIF